MVAQTTYPAGEGKPAVPAGEPPVVRAQGLVKRYGEIVAVDRMDLSVPAGAVYGLLGPNGAGKTTCMRILFGLIRPDEGSIELFGRAELAGRVEALEDVAGFVETPRFYPYLSARANLEVLAKLDRRDGAADRIPELLEQVELSERANSKVREFSYGMVQRLGVAAALMREPRLLVLDEPTNGLDPAGIRDMRRLIQRLADSGLTVLLSSHHMDEVEEMCTRVAIMRRGQLAFDGSMAELRGRAGRATRHLATPDDTTALAICEVTRGVIDVTLDGSRIVFDADDETVERLSRDLVAGGLAIRFLHAPTTSLETLFCRLTDVEATHDEEAVA